MTELDRLKLENINLKLDALEAQRTSLLAERDRLTAVTVATPVKTARKVAAKTAPVAVAKKKGGWPKGKKRGPRKVAAESIEFPNSEAVAAQ